MSAVPSLSTKRLLLRPRGLADLEACVAMDRDPEVVRYIDVPWSAPDEHRAFVRERILRSYPAGLGYWTLERKTPREPFLGWVLLMPYDGVGPQIEIGWRLNRCW